MKVTVTSDLARLQSLQRQAVAARSNLDVAGQEMTSVRKADVFEAAGGNLTRLFTLDRAIERSSIYLDTIALAETRMDVVQESLARIYEPIESLSVNLLGAVGLGDVQATRQYAAQSRRSLAEAVGLLNVRVGGHALFGGAATNGAPLIDSATILADLDAIAAASTTAQEAVEAIGDYFTATPAGGFFTTAYRGSDVDLSAVEIGEGETIAGNLRADQEEIVSVLRGHALAAVVAGGAFEGDEASQKRLLTVGADQLLEARDNILALRAQVGVSQGTLERAQAERTSERDTFEAARTQMLSADPMETATRFQALEAQLEAIYTVTSRLSSLRFVNFMR